jgi:hypothetical protein
VDDYIDQLRKALGLQMLAAVLVSQLGASLQQPEVLTGQPTLCLQRVDEVRSGKNRITSTY